MAFPIKKGTTSVSVDLSLSALLPGALAHTETKVTATATGGDELFCMDIKSAPAVDEVDELAALATASQLKLAWTDCGDSSTHTKITSFTPSSITTGQKATMTGTGDLDEDVSGANFDLEMKTLAGSVSCKGDASQSKTRSLPLGVGSLTFNAMTFPIKQGSTSVSVDLSLSAMLPGALAHTETKVTAAAADGGKLFCMDIKSAPAEDEFVDLSPLYIKSVPEVDVDLPVKWTFPEKPCADLCKLVVDKHSPTGAVYQCECHNITTPDGFVLQTARIPSQKTFNNTKLPVFLMHGFITSAIDWVSQPYTTDSLPYMLSDAGYDVWLGNNRGNIFSVHNERMDINTPEFWDAIDFDQMAELDVPAIIGYVTKTTGAPKMHWVGHSMGGGVLVEALALDPSLKDRLSTSALLAPGVHMANLKVGLLKTMVATHMDTTWRKIGVDIPSIETHNKYFPGPGFSHIMEYFTGKTPLCRVSVKLCNDIGKIMGINVGDPKNLDPKTMALAYNLDPGGASFHLIMHWAQRIREDTIKKFDWGKQNPAHYNGARK